MHTWPLVLFPLFLLLAAAAMMASHVRAWRRVRQQDLRGDDLDFHRRQYRRRMQTSAMLGLLAVAIVAGQLLTRWAESKLVEVGYLAAALVLLAWLVLLAVVDIVATTHHFGRLRRTYLVEQAKLQAELRRIRTPHGNGKPRGQDPQPRSEEQQSEE